MLTADCKKMNLKEFVGYIKSPEVLDEKTAPVIKDLLTEFPYCPTIHLLYVRNLHNTKDIYFESYLKVAAAHSAEREKLFWLLNTPEKPQTKNPATSFPDKIEKELDLPYYEMRFEIDLLDEKGKLKEIEPGKLLGYKTKGK